MDLVRLRLREARQEADGREPAPRKRAASKTADLADAVQSAIAIAENLDLGEPDPDDFDQEQAVQELRRVLRAQRMGRIHRYGQQLDCLIFNFVATNTIEGRVLQRLLDKLKEIRDALDDDAVFNVVGEVLPAAQVERVLRDYYAGRLGQEDLEDRLLRAVDEESFRYICQTGLEGLASHTL